MSFFIFLFFLLSIIFSEKTERSQNNTRKLQTDGYSNLRIYTNVNCLLYEDIEEDSPSK